jgi:hypothetical protein
VAVGKDAFADEFFTDGPLPTADVAGRQQSLRRRQKCLCRRLRAVGKGSGSGSGAVVMNMPNDKAPGPDSFTSPFYKVAWDIIKADVLNAFNVFWAQDGRSFSHLNGTYMVLLKKKAQPAEIQDYRPISLIHSFSKLITKCMANRLAPRLDALVCRNQSAFIKGRCIHDNFRTIRLSCKALHAKRS